MNNKNLLVALEAGTIRVAKPGLKGWDVDIKIKQGILDLFKNSKVVDMPGGFCDKEPFIPRSFNGNSGVRIVPGGTAVRPGSFIGKNVVIMPPSYINIGAYIDDNTMIDSHVLVGSCAQIGKTVHISAGVQIGGVLEPIGNRPVIIEDNAFVGAGAILVEGIVVGKNSVIAPGVVLSASIPIYDTVNKKIIKGIIPENAVVVQGSRKLNKSSWVLEQELSLCCAIIIKYRDEKTDASLELENLLRS